MDGRIPSTSGLTTLIGIFLIQLQYLGKYRHRSFSLSIVIKALQFMVKLLLVENMHYPMSEKFRLGVAKKPQTNINIRQNHKHFN